MHNIAAGMCKLPCAWSEIVVFRKSCHHAYNLGTCNRPVVADVVHVGLLQVAQGCCPMHIWMLSQPCAGKQATEGQTQLKQL